MIAYRNACDTPRRVPRKSTRIIRRVLLIGALLFAVTFALAYFNPLLHRGPVACMRGAA